LRTPCIYNLYALAECTSSEDTTIFSRARSRAYLSDLNFSVAMLARILSYISENLSDCQQRSITVLERLLEDPFFGSHGEMHTAGFVWFNLIVQDQGNTTTSPGSKCGPWGCGCAYVCVVSGKWQSVLWRAGWGC
jgi:hypothetical protein